MSGERLNFQFSHFTFHFIHPLRFARPPVSEGQFERMSDLVFRFPFVFFVFVFVFVFVHFFGNMNFFFHLRGWVAWGKFISMGCAVCGEDIHTAMLSIHLEAEPKVGCILSEPRV